MSKDEAKQQALAFAQCTEDRIEIDPNEAGPPPWAGGLCLRGSPAEHGAGLKRD
jgi:hypothetical protein